MGGGGVARPGVGRPLATGGRWRTTDCSLGFFLFKEWVDKIAYFGCKGGGPTVSGAIARPGVGRPVATDVPRRIFVHWWLWKGINEVVYLIKCAMVLTCYRKLKMAGVNRVFPLELNSTLTKKGQRQPAGVRTNSLTINPTADSKAICRVRCTSGGVP